jgi:hypothetical protein
MLAAVSAKRVVLPFLLLLAVLFIDHFFVRSVFSELDILEHFIFGFIISEAASRIALSGGDGRMDTREAEQEEHAHIRPLCPTGRVSSPWRFAVGVTGVLSFSCIWMAM